MKREVGKHMMYDGKLKILSCLHCNQYRMIDMPMPLDDFCKVLQAFVALHNSCEKLVGVQ
jgi:hypothetical protein